MKLLLVLESDETLDLISRTVKALGFDLIHYYSVVKAMDNLDEVDPHALVVSAKDFPRHWKILVQFIRTQRPVTSCPVVVLKGDTFPLEESAKAAYLRVNAVVTETLSGKGEIDKVRQVLGWDTGTVERRKSPRYRPDGRSRFGFALSSRADTAIITGVVQNISVTGLSFSPDYSAWEWARALPLGTTFVGCSLRAGDAILAPECRLVRPGRVISLEFTSFPDGESAVLTRYIEGIGEQETGTEEQRSESGEQVPEKSVS